MITKLRLQNFKNFKDAELHLGRFTLLVGENSSGKSNIRDAFRFLHGISRGYSLADILGEKWGSGGEIQWTGIRGGTREVAFRGASSFALEVTFLVEGGKSEKEAVYRIEVDPGVSGNAPRIIDERLTVQGENDPIFRPNREVSSRDKFRLVLLKAGGKRLGEAFLNQQPALSQLVEAKRLSSDVRKWAEETMGALSDLRFLDLSPEAMRRPSLPGQTVLGDRGENLSSVLQSIYNQPSGKDILVEWLHELTPMDAKEFEFIPDSTGKILLTLVEKNGQRTSGYSASDGTLRFLAIIAAFLGPKPAKLHFIEELDTGLHPTRLHLLLQLVEQYVANGDRQIIATTHSPQFLSVLSEQALQNASLVYRLENQPDAHISRIIDLYDARRLFEQYDPAELLTSGWMENTATFTSNGETTS
ncbi:MAG: AAA family ATPase [Ardenticatenales bacterium]|nr:AAA family ATPase [Ardenticatenales bacterium]